MDQHGCEPALTDGQQESGGQRPGQCRPCAQARAPGRGSRGEPGSQSGQRHRRQKQQADQAVSIEPDMPRHGDGQGEQCQKRIGDGGVPVAGSGPRGPGGAPQASPGGSQTDSGAARDGAGDQQGAQTDSRYDDGHQQDAGQNDATAAGQRCELAQLQFAGSSGARNAFALLAEAIPAHRANVGGIDVETGQDRAAHGGVGRQALAASPDGTAAARDGQSGPQLGTGKGRGFGQQSRPGTDDSQDEEPDQKQGDGPVGESRPSGQLSGAARAEGAVRVGIVCVHLRSRGLLSHGGAPGSASLRGAQPQVAGATVLNDGLRNDDDAVPGQSNRSRQLKTVVEDRELRRGAIKFFPHGAIDEGAGGTDRQDIGAVVVLPLIDLARHNVIGPARRRGGAQPHLEELLGIVPIDLLGPDQCGGSRLRNRREKSLEAARRRCDVIVEQPQPALGPHVLPILPTGPAGGPALGAGFVV